ncbi:hypothetical protein BU17DRAFT_94818 [Hysterangium stoloniferum]|nr:hypothetical protein BU17DRAFT_94818 [Hysterangium stoloniferum]
MATAETVQGVEGLPPLVSTDVLNLSSEEPGEILESRKKERFRLEIRERWSCNEPGHDLCCRTVADDQHIPLSALHVEVWIDELCQGKTSSHDAPTVGRISERPTTTTSDHQEGVKEQPPLVSSCYRDPDDEEHIPDDHQHTPLSANDAEVPVDESLKGDTSDNDPPTVAKMAGMPTNTTSNPRADEQPPLVPPGEPSSDQRDQIIKTGMSEIVRVKLPERWNCTDPGHDLCYPSPDDNQYIPLSANYVERCVGELCQGAPTYHDPPTVVEMSGRPTNTTSNHLESIEVDVPDDHTHMPLSANDAGVRIDEMFQGETTYQDPLTVVKMPKRSTNITSNLREDVKKLPHLSSDRVPEDDEDILSVNHIEGSADEFKLCQGATSCHYPPTVVTMPERFTTTISNLREGVEEVPFVSPVELSQEERDEIIKTGMREIFRKKLRDQWSCNETGHDLCYRALVNDQHISLSANHVEFWVNELCNGNTSYHDLPTFGKTPWSSTNTTSNLREGVDGLPPLRSPGVLSSKKWDQIVSTGMKEIFRAKLRERWSCNETAHNLCYIAPDDDQHIPLSPNDINIWVEELCQGETTYHEPPTAVTMPGRFTSATSYLSPYGIHDWGCSEIEFGTTSSIEIEPGYHFGLSLERVGRQVLYNAKVAGWMAKLTMYGRMVNFSSRDKTLNKLLRKSATLPRWGIVIQESIELLRPSYPPQIRGQAARILGDFWLCYDEIPLTNNRDTMTLKLMASLGRAFTCCPGAQWWDRNTSSAITSLLYSFLVQSRLHTNLNEVSSAFVMGIAYYLSDPDTQHPLLIGALVDVIENVCHTVWLRITSAFHALRFPGHMVSKHICKGIEISAPTYENGYPDIGSKH